MVNEKIDEGALRGFSHVERMENHKIAKTVYIGECAGSRSVGRQRKAPSYGEGVFKKKWYGCQTSKENGPV